MSEYRRQITVGAVIALVATIGFAFALETAIPSTTSTSASSVTTATSTVYAATISGANETILVHVVNSSNGAGLPGVPVLAEPANPPGAAQRVNLCWYNQPGGSAIVNSNGTALLNNGTLAQVPECPVQGVTTNSTGWATITNQDSAYFFIQVGSVSFNSDIVALNGAGTTYVSAPYPTGNFVVSSGGTTVTATDDVSGA